MRKLIPQLAVALVFSAVTLVWAAEEKTITGEGQCAKCSLGKTKSCQNAIVAKDDDGKEVTYYLTQNKVSKAFHKNICQTTKKVKATGEVKEEKENGETKMVLTPTKLELVD